MKTVNNDDVQKWTKQDEGQVTADIVDLVSHAADDHLEHANEEAQKLIE